jgi:hypothetical protein
MIHGLDTGFLVAANAPLPRHGRADEGQTARGVRKWSFDSIIDDRRANYPPETWQGLRSRSRLLPLAELLGSICDG